MSSGEALPDGEGELQLEHIPDVEISLLETQKGLYDDILLSETDL
jgi:hypothetical protein